MIRQRIIRLEQKAQDLGAGACRQCYGTAVALVRHSEGTGDYFLSDARNRITDDLRCRACGQPIAKIILLCGLPDRPADADERKIPYPGSSSNSAHPL